MTTRMIKTGIVFSMLFLLLSVISLAYNIQKPSQSDLYEGYTNFQFWAEERWENPPAYSLYVSPADVTIEYRDDVINKIQLQKDMGYIALAAAASFPHIRKSVTVKHFSGDKKEMKITVPAERLFKTLALEQTSEEFLASISPPATTCTLKSEKPTMEQDENQKATVNCLNDENQPAVCPDVSFRPLQASFYGSFSPNRKPSDKKSASVTSTFTAEEVAEFEIEADIGVRRCSAKLKVTPPQPTSCSMELQKDDMVINELQGVIVACSGIKKPAPCPIKNIVWKVQGGQINPNTVSTWEWKAGASYIAPGVAGSYAIKVTLPNGASCAKTVSVSLSQVVKVEAKFGWNLVSIPIKSKVTDILGTAQAVIYRYTGKWERFTGTELDPGAYFVEVDKQSTLKIPAENPTKVGVNKGWNAVGLPISAEKKLKDVTLLVGSTDVILYRFDPATQRWKGVVSEDIISPREGYLVFTKEAGTLSIAPPDACSINPPNAVMSNNDGKAFTVSCTAKKRQVACSSMYWDTTSPGSLLGLPGYSDLGPYDSRRKPTQSVSLGMPERGGVVIACDHPVSGITVPTNWICCTSTIILKK